MKVPITNSRPFNLFFDIYIPVTTEFSVVMHRGIRSFISTFFGYLFSLYQMERDSQCTYNVTLRGVRAAIFVVEKQ
jgi:hypothetical protein